MDTPITTHGEKVLAKTGSQPGAAKSVREQSAKSGGRDMSDVLPSGELLAILTDHLLRLEKSGFRVEFAALPDPSGKHPGVAFILYGVKKVDGRLVAAE
jgi:hypothetical protein